MPDGELAARLWQLRQGTGLTQEALAVELGVSTGAVASWEDRAAPKKPRPQNLVKFSRVVRCDPNELLRLADYPLIDDITLSRDEHWDRLGDLWPDLTIGERRALVELVAEIIRGHPSEPVAPPVATTGRGVRFRRGIGTVPDRRHSDEGEPDNGEAEPASDGDESGDDS